MLIVCKIILFWAGARLQFTSILANLPGNRWSLNMAKPKFVYESESAWGKF
jgi:hypothetical protein